MASAATARWVLTAGPALADAVRASEVFAALSAADLLVLERQLAAVHLDAGARLFSQGDAADAVYLLVSGALEAVVKGEDTVSIVGSVRPGELVGEMQVLFGGVRSATVLAREPSRLAAIPKSAFDSLDKGALGERLSDLILRRLRRNQLVEALGALFGALDGETIRQVEAACQWISVRRGEVVCTAGETSDCLYVVVNGWLRAFALDARGMEVPLSDLGRGECVGEMALITGEPRMATVRALRDSDLVRLDKAAADAFLRAHPDALLHITRVVVKRYQSALRAAPVRRAARSIALLPLSKDRALLPQFGAALGAALATYGPVIYLTSSSVDEHLGVRGISGSRPGSAEALRLSAWLRHLEEHHRFILLEADPETAHARHGVWTERVMRDADEQLLVARAADAPHPADAIVSPAVERSAERVRLVLMHNGAREPCGTAAWLSRHPVNTHHHCREGSRDDIARVARFIAGTQTGLVLGGGGVRGLAHVGVIRALLEAGVPVDMVGGTSIGAIIAVQLALRRSPERILRDTVNAFAGLLDYTLPAVALAAGKRLGRSLREAMGDLQFEDTWLPCFCVASNLTRAEVAVLDRGVLWRAVRASCGLPGVFPPVGMDGDLLVDGCLLNNLPVDIMARRCEGPIVAVDATPTVDLEAQGWSGDAISGFRYLLGHASPLAEKPDLPGIARILQRACELSGVHTHRERLRDSAAGLLLTPAVSGFPTLDMTYADRAVEAGYRAAVAALREWPGRRTAPTNISPASPLTDA